ncbi:hypothetical protein DYB37_003910 [Aphanomyces astaci]|uniref:RNA helicase n=1 Tax=Aphanomyces astaci TaxID=112090 RepID=A0A418DVJ8_APHAT|nr:hypothetical protein DYB35_003968 [Aphanomyces astaci]RHZ21893.1 hypothetical protein DYB37_003910 [Aphanomyces astaci]
MATKRKLEDTSVHVDGEHDDAAAMDAAEWRDVHLISTTSSGNDVVALPDPLRTFQSTPFSAAVVAALEHAGFTAPSPTQAQSWPVALSKKDLISIAKTGSGKTLGFLLPSFHHLAKATRVQQTRTKAKHKYAFPVRSKDPRMVVLVPTRELAMQIEKEAKRFLKAFHPALRAVAVFGGAEKKAQLEALEMGVDCCVATPGRLLDLRDSVSLAKVDILVLDEADKMLEMGFERQLQALQELLPSTTRQTLLCSATWPLAVQSLAASFVRPDAVTVITGAFQVNPAIRQTFELCSNVDAKAEQLVSFCHKHKTTKTLVFFKTKQGCDAMEKLVKQHLTAGDDDQKRHKAADVVVAVHGDKPQADRTMALNQFKNGSCLLLFATDVASRGLHVHDIHTVINYDCPDSEETYIHRIGRTGRAGATGTAISYVTDKDRPLVKKLLRVLKEADQVIPPAIQAWCRAVHPSTEATTPATTTSNKHPRTSKVDQGIKKVAAHKKHNKKTPPPQQPKQKKKKQVVGKRKQRLCL